MAIERSNLFPPPHRFTVAEYLAFEERSEFKHEFIDGVIYDCGDPLPGDPAHPDYVPGYPMPHLFSVAEYLAFEAESEFKHEFIDGIIYEMTGGTLDHSRIKVNLIRILLSQLDDSLYEVLNSDMRVGISEGRYVYPDLSVLSGAAQLTDDDMILLNPILTAEVTSPTSLDYDRQTKLEYYRALSSMKMCLIIDPHQILVELHSRADNGWHWQSFSAIGDVISLESIGCDLPLAEIYRGINFSDD